MDKIKYVKIERADGSLSDNIPLSADAINIIMANGNNAEDEINKKADKIEIEELIKKGPLIANSISEMTDITKTYINITNGHWYYYDGEEWVKYDWSLSIDWNA